MLLDNNLQEFQPHPEFILPLIKRYSYGLVNIDADKILSHLLLELVSTDSISETLVSLTRICNNLISEIAPDYQYLAGRLHMITIYRQVYGEGISKSVSIPSISTLIKKGIASGAYANLEVYNDEELAHLETVIQHDRDYNITYASWLSFETRYLSNNKATGEIYETPQIMYMLIAMYGFKNYTGEQRLSLVSKFYDALSLSKINLPTPILTSMRTKFTQYSSCVLIEVGDSVKSQARTIECVMNYSANSAGIGINIGGIRGLGSVVREGRQLHQGYIPYIKLLESAIKSISQGGVRNGAMTVFYPIWNLEIESLLVLKNNRGNEDNRVRHIDYGVQISKIFYERLIQKKNISLFSTSEVPGLYEAFFRDQQEFERIYTAAEQNPNIRQKVIPAADLFTVLLIERSQTGRIYIQHVDHCNDFSTFNEHAPSIKGSNLCMEVLLPTTPVRAEDNEYEIAVCTISALNIARISKEELPDICNILVRFLDDVVEYQYYPLMASNNSARKRRSLGIGVTGLAHFLAQNHIKYEDEAALNLIHTTFEAIQYYMIQASVDLAKERGPCSGFPETTYSQGIMPIDRYKKEIDNYHTADLLLDWDNLRARVLKHGMRNSTLTAVMPCESSSILSNSTNGIEPPRSAITSKQGKQGYYKFVVPDYLNLKEHYTFLWRMKSNVGYLRICGIMQKFIDQAISTNTSYNPNSYPQRLVSLEDILADVILSYKLGLKTLYYQNTLDDITENQEEEDCGCTV